MAIRDDILESYERLGGVDYLERLGREEPSIYARLLQACIPKEVNLGIQQDTSRLLERLRGDPELREAKLQELRSRLASSAQPVDCIEVESCAESVAD
jgi:hypothetical protein